MTAAPAPTRERGHLFLPHHFHRPKILKWLRRTHAWLGLWGAVLGLLFGFTGILLNHRAVMKIPAAHTAETRLEIELPKPLPATPEALIAFLQQHLALDAKPGKPRVEPARTVPWGTNAKLRQPERWQLSLAASDVAITAEYWVGNRYVSVRRLDPNFFAWLNRLHTGAGAGVGWILLVDTLAGGLIVLALTGLLLWTRLHGTRLLGAGFVCACLTLALTFALTGF